MKKIIFAVIILLIGGMIMSYTRVNWQNAPSTATPVNAENLNTMDKGIADAHSQLASISNYVGTSFEFKGVAFPKIHAHNGWAYSKYKWDDSTKEIVSLSFEGSYHGSWDGAIYFRRKPKYTDVFSEPIEVANFRSDGIGCTCQAFEIAQNGDYVALISKMQTTPAQELGTWIYRSTDKGNTWVEEAQLIVDEVPIIAITGDVTNLYRLRNGRLLSWGWFVSPYKQIFTLYSDDNGHTFCFGTIDGSVTAFEPAFCELDDGTIVALLRDDLGSTTKTPALFTRSLDGGLTWEKPTPSNTILDMTDNNGVFIKRENSNIIEFINCSRLKQADGYKSVYQSVFTQEQAKNGDFGTQTRILRIDGSSDFGYPAALVTDDDIVYLYFYTGAPDDGTICYMVGTNKTTYLNQPENFDYLTGEINNNLLNFYSNMFEQGAFNGGVTGLADVMVETTNRLRLKEFSNRFAADKMYLLNCNNNKYQIVVRQYNEDYICIKDSGWQQTYAFLTYPSCKYVKFVIRKTNNTPIVPAEIRSNLFTIIPYALETNDMEPTLFEIATDEVYSRHQCYYRKKDGWVSLSFEVSKIDGTTISQGETILTLPTGFRPGNNVYAQAIGNEAAATPPFKLAVVRVLTTGDIKVIDSAGAKNIKGSVMFYAGGGTM